MQAAMLYCPQCGTPNGTDHRFCARCGSVLPAPAAPAYQAPAPHYQAQQYAPPAPQYQAPAPQYAPPQPPAYNDNPYGGYAAGAAAAPVWGAPAPTYHPGAFGYPVAAPRHATGARRHHAGFWALGGSLVGLVLIGLIVVGVLAIHPRPASCYGPGCVVPPPAGTALAAPHTYTSSTYHYTVHYYNAPGGYDPGLASRIKVTSTTATGIDWSVDLSGADPAGGTWPYGFQGMRANGQSAKQIVQSVASQDAQGGKLVFPIPNPMIGFVPGYGAVYDVQAQTEQGGVIESRFIVMASVHNGLAIVFTALGPYNNQQEEHPDPTDTLVSVVVSPLVNDVTFPGMPVR